MATWKDGAAYAPLERPDGFAAPVADPLPVAEPHLATTPGPMHHPSSFDSAPQRPLTDLAVSTTRRRDPREGFEIASLAMTAAPGEISVRDPSQPFSTAPLPAGNSIQAPPAGDPLDIEAPAPSPSAYPPPTVHPRPGGQVPGAAWPGVAPGQPPQPQWRPPAPGAGPFPGQGGPPATANSQRTLGWVCVGLSFAGLLLSGAAPFLLLVAGVLGLRTRSLTTWVGPTTLGVGLFSLLVQLGIGELGSPNALLGILSFLCCVGFLVTMLRNGQAG